MTALSLICQHCLGQVCHQSNLSHEKSGHNTTLCTHTVLDVIQQPSLVQTRKKNKVDGLTVNEKVTIPKITKLFFCLVSVTKKCYIKNKQILVLKRLFENLNILILTSM